MDTIKLVFGCFVFSLVIFSTIAYKDCGSTGPHVDRVLINGQDNKGVVILKRGQTANLTVEFTASENTAKATSVVHGIIAGIPVPFQIPDDNACDGMKPSCPIVTNQKYIYNASLDVKKIYPKMTLIVKWEITDDNGKDLICVVIPATISD